MIRVENLCKSLHGKTVLNDISFEVASNEFIAIIGMSGSGKSVLLKHLVGLMQADSGTIRFEGKKLNDMTTRELETLGSRMGFVFQNGALFDSMTVFDNVAFPLKERGEVGRTEILERVQGILDQVGLSGMGHKYPSEISGGMAKRTAPARALICEPDYLLFDEPTTGLDPIIRKSMLKLFKTTQARLKSTGIIVSHDIPEVFHIVHKVALLYQGSFLVIDTPEALFRSKDPIVRQFIRGDIDGPIRYN